MDEHSQCLDIELSRDPTQPPSPGSWLKQCLLYFRNPRAPAGHWQSRAGLGRAYTCQPECSQRLLLVTGVLLFLGLGVLLLLWNYQCIFIWGLCREEEPAVPRFGGLAGFDREEPN